MKTYEEVLKMVASANRYPEGCETYNDHIVHFDDDIDLWLEGLTPWELITAHQMEYQLDYSDPDAMRDYFHGLCMYLFTYHSYLADYRKDIYSPYDEVIRALYDTEKPEGNTPGIDRIRSLSDADLWRVVDPVDVYTVFYTEDPEGFDNEGWFALVGGMMYRYYCACDGGAEQPPRPWKPWDNSVNGDQF